MFLVGRLCGGTARHTRAAGSQTLREHISAVPRSLDIIFGSGVSSNALLSITNRFFGIGSFSVKMDAKTFTTPTLSPKLKSPSSYKRLFLYLHTFLEILHFILVISVISNGSNFLLRWIQKIFWTSISIANNPYFRFMSLSERSGHSQRRDT